MLYSLLAEIVFNRWSVHSLNIFDYIRIALIVLKSIRISSYKMIPIK